MSPEGLTVYVDDITATWIEQRAKSEVVELIASKVVAKYGGPIIEEVKKSITAAEVRRRVIAKIADEIIDNWANERSQHDTIL